MAGRKVAKRSYKRKKAEEKKPELNEPSPAPQVAEDTAKAAPSYFRGYTAEDEIATELSQIRYGWGRIAEIAKRQQRNTAT